LLYLVGVPSAPQVNALTALFSYCDRPSRTGQENEDANAIPDWVFNPAVKVLHLPNPWCCPVHDSHQAGQLIATCYRLAVIHSSSRGQAQVSSIPDPALGASRYTRLSRSSNVAQGMDLLIAIHPVVCADPQQYLSRWQRQGLLLPIYWLCLIYNKI
jgi:hypothetical protein